MNDEAMRAEADKIINGKYMGDYDEFESIFLGLVKRKCNLQTDMREMINLLKKRKKIPHKRILVDHFTDRKEQFERQIYMYEQELCILRQKFKTIKGTIENILLDMVKVMLKSIKRIRERHDLLISGYTRLTT